MSAVNVPSEIGFGVTLMPANPISPFNEVKVERYAPGGGSNLVGDVGEDAVEEHAPMSSVQMMSGAVNTIERSRGTVIAHVGLFVIDIPSVSRERKKQARNVNGSKKA